MNEPFSGQVEVTFPSQTRFLYMITMLANNAALLAGFDQSVAGKVGIATDEAVTNVIKHAYKGATDKTIKVKIEIQDDGLTLEIFHKGAPLRNEDIKLPDMDEYIKARRVGGLGLFLITKLMDEVDYVVGEEHCCKLKKYRQTDAAGGN